MMALGDVVALSAEGSNLPVVGDLPGVVEQAF
jgi:hypothetical protein